MAKEQQLTSDVVFREDQVGCDGQSRYSGLRDRQASGERGPGLMWKVHQAVKKSTRQVRMSVRERGWESSSEGGSLATCMSVGSPPQLMSENFHLHIPFLEPPPLLETSHRCVAGVCIL